MTQQADRKTVIIRRRDGTEVESDAEDALITTGLTAVDYYVLQVECQELKARLAAAEEYAEGFIIDAVTQECRLQSWPGHQPVYTHSFMSAREEWIDFLVQRGVMFAIDDDRALYVFRDHPT